MKKIATIGVALAALFAVTAAQAITSVYKITKIDAAAHTVTLGNNQTYSVDASVDLTKFKVGDQVSITFTTNNGKNNATALTKL